MTAREWPMRPADSLEIRELCANADLRQVIDLERRVWGYPDGEEAVPLPILASAARRGAIVLGAFEGRAMIGASYAFPAIRDGALTLWSHMLGVVEEARGRGVGRAIKLRQRECALERDIDLIEWTFDPLQAGNAHFNLVRLGAVVEAYEVNLYGESVSPLWNATESDRFIAQWYIREPHVERRLARRGPLIRASETVTAARVLEARVAGELMDPGEPILDEESHRLRVEIPHQFAPIQQSAPDIARAWRSATRSVFTTYLSRGYRVIDFWVDRRRACGTYLMARHDVAARREAA